MGSRRGFSLIELLVVVATIGVVAAIAAPGLLRARMSGNEASAIGSLRTIKSAEATYASSCGGDGYAQSLEDLSQPPAPGHQPFVSPDLATTGVVKSGYVVALAAEIGAVVVRAAAATCNGAAADTVTAYHATATPVTVGFTGLRSFATDAGSALFVDTTGILIPNPVPAGQTVLQ